MTADTNPRRALFATDQEKEKNGVVLSYGNMRIRIARAGGTNAKFATILDDKTSPYRRMIQNEALPNKIAEQILREAYAEAVVLEVSDYDDDGKLLKTLTKEEVLAEFNDPDYGQEFYAFCFAEANRVANFRLRAREDVQKN